MLINKNKLHFTRQFFLSHKDWNITLADAYDSTEKWNAIWINLWKWLKCYQVLIYTLIRFKILQQCTLYVTIQHMISNYDIEARQLSIDKQRQWCNIYTLLRTVILFSCLPSFHLYLTTGKWKILPLIDTNIVQWYLD